VDQGDHGSLGELSAVSVTSLMQPSQTQAAAAEQMMSVVQLVKYLNNLMVSVNEGLFTGYIPAQFNFVKCDSPFFTTCFLLYRICIQ
jgi:hypothetical protein